jgi:hypothetical protein
VLDVRNQAANQALRGQELPLSNDPRRSAKRSCAGSNGAGTGSDGAQSHGVAVAETCGEDSPSSRHLTANHKVASFRSYLWGQIDSGCFGLLERVVFQIHPRE